MNLILMETFVWLAKLKNFSNTAKKMNTTQPAISIRMKRLEDYVGATLYDRKNGEFELTPQGRHVLDKAEKILKMAKDLANIPDLVDGEMTEIRVGVIEIGTLSWLRLFVDGFRDTFDSTVLYITTGNSHSLMEQLRDNLIDIAFVIGPVNEPNIHSDQICGFALDWYANPNAFPCDHEIDIVELSEMPIIDHGKGSAVVHAVARYLEAYGIVDRPAHHRRVVLDCVYSAWTAGHAVREGLGVMALPSFLFKDDIETGKIAPLKVRQKMQAMNVTACYKDGRNELSIARTVSIAQNSAATFAKTQRDSHFWI